MKVVLVTGGRELDAWHLIDRVLKEEAPDMIIQGGALGADYLASKWAHDNVVMELRVPAAWKRHGKYAGPKRNEAMVRMAGEMASLGHEVQVIAFPGGRGTANCIATAERMGLHVRKVKGD